VLLTALPDEDYEPNTEIANRVIEYSDNGKVATITGSIIIREDDPEDYQLWIAAVAYNDGIPVGVRKWISPETLVADEEVEFEIKLYSLGPPINGFKLFSELYKIN
jgi:hypothetical protein